MLYSACCTLAQSRTIADNFPLFIAEAAKLGNITSVTVRGDLVDSCAISKDDCVQVEASKIQKQPFKRGRLVVDGIVVSAIVDCIPLSSREKLHILECRGNITTENIRQFVDCPYLTSVMFQLDVDEWDFVDGCVFKPNGSVRRVTIVVEEEDFLTQSLSIVKQTFPNAIVSTTSMYAMISRGNLFPARVIHSPQLTQYVQGLMLDAPRPQFIALFKKAARLDGTSIATYQSIRGTQILTLDEYMPLAFDAPETSDAINNVWLGDKRIAARFVGTPTLTNVLKLELCEHSINTWAFPGIGSAQADVITLAARVIMPNCFEHLVYVEFLHFDIVRLRMLGSMPNLARIVIGSTSNIPVANFNCRFPNVRRVEMPKMTNNAIFLSQFPNVELVDYRAVYKKDRFRHMYFEFYSTNSLKLLKMFIILSHDPKFTKKMQNKVDNFKL
ncbi:MAG: hypothetical protein MUO31_10145 [Thermodesulfovibrionales bacterium]|nr:hypothetical protein [Thermodesulfovibrionales bacterium]